MTRLRQRALCDAHVAAEMNPWAALDEAMERLVQWDRECREAHEAFMAETGPLIAAIKEHTA